MNREFFASPFFEFGTTLGFDVEPPQIIMAELPETISINAAGELLGLTAERVRQLIKAGYVPSAGRGRTTLKGAVSGYIAFVREDRRAARSRARAADEWRTAVGSLASHLRHDIAGA